MTLAQLKFSEEVIARLADMGYWEFDADQTADLVREVEFCEQKQMTSLSCARLLADEWGSRYAGS